MKKIFGGIFLTLLVLILAVGCSSSDNTESTSGTPEANNGEVESGNENEKKSDYPNKPITMIIPYSAGGGTDATGRALAQAAEDNLGTSIGVVNKTGGGGSVGMSAGINSKPDGYTVTMFTVELTTLPHLGLAPFTFEDVKPVAQINFDPAAITVPADAPYNTVEEFIDYAKNNPGKIRVGNSGTGAIWHLAAAGFEKATGIEFTHVPFEGAAPAVTSLLGGHIEAVTVSPAEVLSQVESGDLKTLAVMSPERSAALPDVPTLKEKGIEVPNLGPWRGIGVPKDTPDEVVKVLEKAFMEAADEEEFKTFMKNNGLGLVIQDSEGFGNVMEESSNSFGELIPELGLNK